MLEKCGENCYEIVIGFLTSLGLEREFLEKCYLYFIDKGSSMRNVYCITKECASALRNFGIEKKRVREAGTFIGRIVDNNFTPSLELGREIISHYTRGEKQSIPIIRLDLSNALSFTQGKTISLKHAFKQTSKRFVLVVYEDNFIGWGSLRKGILYPQSDIGLYIRRGD